MIVTLSGTWILSTEHAASSYGQPVLVHRPSCDAFGPADIVEAAPSYGLLPARDAVARLAKTATIGADGRALVARFTGGAR
jgi:hypothetical protein